MTSLSFKENSSDLVSTNASNSILVESRIITESMNNTYSYVEVFHNDKNGITRVSMSRPPVNSINEEFARELIKAIETAANTMKSKGIILTSSVPSIFSAGLDINELYQPDNERLRKLWYSLQELFLTLYGLGIPTAAAINGASPAGGCLLALSCEYRVMIRGERTIGLNGTRIGISVPKWFQDIMIDIIGYRQAELALTRGTLFKPLEALRIGLIDELATDKDDAIGKCEKFISDFNGIPSDVRREMKASLRKDKLTWLEKNRELDVKNFLKNIELPEVQETLEKHLQSLKTKSK